MWDSLRWGAGNFEKKRQGIPKGSREERGLLACNAKRKAERELAPTRQKLGLQVINWGHRYPDEPGIGVGDKGQHPTGLKPLH